MHYLLRIYIKILQKMEWECWRCKACGKKLAGKKEDPPWWMAGLQVLGNYNGPKM